MTDADVNNFPASLGNVTFGARVGIGTMEPISVLSVVNSDSGEIRALLDLTGESSGRNPMVSVTSAGTETGTPTINIQTASELSGTPPSLSLNPAGGAVGVGTANPGYPLEVDGDALVTGDLFFGAAGAALRGDVAGGSLDLGPATSASGETPAVNFHFGGGTAQPFNVQLVNAADGRLDIATAANGPIMSVVGTNVGIGNTNPQTALHIGGGTFGSFRVGSTPHAGLDYDVASGDLYLGGDNSQAGDLFLRDRYGSIAVEIHSEGDTYLRSGALHVYGGEGLDVLGPIRATGALMEIKGSTFAGITTRVHVIFDSKGFPIGSQDELVFNANDGFAWLDNESAGHADLTTGPQLMRLAPDGSLWLGVETPRIAIDANGCATYS